MIDLDELEKLARAATPGPWTALPDKTYPDRDRCVGIVGPPERNAYDELEPVRLVETDSAFYPPRMKDAAFIAAANPQVVLELISNQRLLAADRDGLYQQVGAEMKSEDLIRAQAFKEAADSLRETARGYRTSNPGNYAAEQLAVENEEMAEEIAGMK